MRKLYGLVFLACVAGAYLHYVQGWDWARLRREPAVALFFPEDASATTTPVGARGTGTHWETARPMPDARAAFGAAVLGNTIYVVGGIDGYFRTLSSALAYDIGADAWRPIARLPQAVHHPAVATDGTRLFVIGGLTGLSSRPLDDVYAYNPAKDAWEAVGRLNDFRGASASAELSGTLYVVGGLTTAGPGADLEYFDPARAGWNGLKPMPTPRAYLAAASYADRLFAIGGRRGSIARNLATVEAYDPKAMTWEPLPELAVARSGHAAASAGGRIYVVGGETKEGTVADVEAYDLKKKAWSVLPTPLPSPRHALAAVAWKDRLYVIGGGRRAGFSVSDLNEVLIIKE
jgi:N-acetylneuraminic acid mutarotase